MQANDSMVAWNRPQGGRSEGGGGRDANAWGGFSHGGTPIVALCLLAAWAGEGYQRFARMGALDADLAAPWPGAGVTLLVRVATLALEAWFYMIVWAAAGRRLAFRPFVTALLMASSVDLCAIALRAAAPNAGAFARILIGGLAGPRGLEPPPALLAAPDGPFATLGVLTLGRITLTAWAQARSLKLGLLAPLLVTAGAWLALHLGMTWYTEFVRGLAHGEMP